MAIEFRCPECGRLLRTGSGTHGKRALCPGCGGFATVPGPDDLPPIAETAAELPAPESEPPVVQAAEADPFGATRAEPVDSDNPYQAPTQYGQFPPPGQGTDNRAVISLVLGITGFFFGVTCCPLLILPFAVTGLMLGVGALQSQSRGIAIAGVVLCGIQLMLGVLGVAMFALAVAFG